ncbi:MAG: type II secretion system protein [Phycisphaerales bacterium]
MIRRSSASRPGYTLLELLVVIVIASLLVGIAIPAVDAILSSSRRTLSESKLQQALYGARDAAAAAVGGGDAAAVFFFEPGAGVRIEVCRQIGSITDVAAGDTVQRDVFAPIPGFQPVQLPPGYGVRGFAVASLFQRGWYESIERVSGNTEQPGYWVFPETHSYPTQAGARQPGSVRQTFMVRFEAGTGVLSRDPTQAVVVAPVSDAVYENWESVRLRDANIDPILETDDLELWTRRVVSSTAGSLIGTDPTVPFEERDARRAVLGDLSPHSVLAAPVWELSLYIERDLARAVGARGVNRRTGTLYLPAGDTVVEPTLDDGVTTLALDEVGVLASKWLEGRLVPADVGGRSPAESTGRLFAVNAYFADLVEITR